MDAYERSLERAMKDPAFRKEWEKTEEDYQLCRAIISARIEGGLTQTELARASGMDQRVLSRIETGESVPTVRTLRKIAHGLGKRLVIFFEPN